MAKPAANRLVKSSTFRLALVYMLLFSTSAVLLLGFIYWSTAGYMARQTDATIEAEITGLAEGYRLTGLDGLVRSLNERLQRNPQGSFVYLLTDNDFRSIVGNLDRWPHIPTGKDGWLSFELEQASLGDEAVHRARAQTFVLRGGFHLLVGRDMHELSETRELIVRTLAWGLGITVLLGIAGGVMMSRSTARRIEAINQTSREIIQGDLSRRIPSEGSGDDFDQLTDNLNSMLDQIQTLMDGVRHVSDNIAHDLRTPLTRLRNRLEAINVQANPERSDIEDAITEADSLLSTFNALLRIARIEAGHRTSGFEVLSISQLVRDVVELYEPLAHDRQQSFSATIEEDLRISGDRDLLFQAIANVLDNAIKYTPERGTVALALSRDDGKALVVIRDSGPGIPQSERGRVFERFVRLESSRSAPGNGLGLSLVAAVVRIHKADVALGGEAGLEVILSFPLAS
ncbi:MAG: HAMP domain-containing histidine kinase [Gammaproteobacteria bacterium]|nr:HAMP domain-containing histidine kinase [Gammaproteobacteria bacterium]